MNDQLREDNIFEAEIKRLYPILKDRLGGLLLDKRDIPDIIQDVMLSISQPSKRPDMMDMIARGSFEYYINRCIYLQAYGSSRAARKRKQHHEITEVIERKMSDMANEFNIEERVKAENLDLIIGKLLPPFDAELMRLWMLDGFNYTECAKFMGVTRSSLYCVNKRSIKKIKEYVHNTKRASGDIH